MTKASTTERPAVICVTPVRNEAWILDRFLRCASLWADHILVADQDSDDGSRDIAARFPKVTLLENPSERFNEPERQKLLLDAARRIPGRRLIIALDADELLSANALTSPEWQTALDAPPGTVIRFDWVIVLSKAARYWVYPTEMPLGFMDDGSEHRGRQIHSPRIPLPPGAPSLSLSEVKVLHLVGVDPERWRSRLRWYQCWESLNRPGRGPLDLYRYYHRDQGVPAAAIRDVPDEWLAGYRSRGIDVTSIARPGRYRWDVEMLDILVRNGPDRFRKLAIWDMDWTALAAELNPDGPHVELEDPRSRLDRLVHGWLARTQPYFSHHGPARSVWRRHSLRWIHKALRRLGW